MLRLPSLSLRRQSLQHVDYPVHSGATVQEYDTSISVALELSRSAWLIAVSAPSSDKISRYRLDAGESEALLNRRHSVR